MTSQNSVIESKDIAILLVGFNRPKLLSKRLDQLHAFNASCLYLSIDGGEESLSIEMKNVVKKAKKMFPKKKLIVNLHKTRLGMAPHVTRAISSVLKKHEFIIVVEDDVVLSLNFIDNLIMGLNFQKKHRMSGIVSGNSHLFNTSKKNKWRKVSAPSVWGWACSRDTWNGYKLNMESQNIETELKNSKLWQKMRRYEKKIWLAKFKKSIKDPNYNWDTQLTYHLLKNDHQSIAPIFSITGNEGFGSINSVHTSYEIPKYIRNNKLSESITDELSKFSSFYQQYDITGIKHRIKNIVR
jgi:hypothetical protein